MSKKIGFRSYDNEKDEEKPNEEDKKTQAIADFLSSHYGKMGTTSAKVYKTTAELVYEIENIVPVSQIEVAAQLSRAGFPVEFVSGVPYWVLYERDI